MMMSGSGTTPTPTPAPTKEIADLAVRAEALRAAIARAQMELEAVSVEERAISERIATLRSPARSASAPLADEKDVELVDDDPNDPDREWRPPTNSPPKPKLKKAGPDRIQAGWLRAPFAKKTTTFEKEPSPVTIAAAPPTPTPTAPKVEQTTTVLLTAPRLRLQRREAWKVALAGAGLAALLGTISIAVYLEISRTPPPPKPTFTTSPPTTISKPTTPPPSRPTSEPDPISSTLTTPPPPVAVPSPAPAPSTTFTSPWRRRLFAPPPSPPPPPAPARPSDEADRILAGALGNSTTTAPTAPPAKPFGSITVVCMPKCDQTIDNGVALGPGHIFNRPVAPGRHVLQLSTANNVNKTVTINVAEGATREIRVSMEPSAPPPPSPLPTPTTPPVPDIRD
jgi:hypothetical protein